jgi:PAS domain S-box-containing protein
MANSSKIVGEVARLRAENETLRQRLAALEQGNGPRMDSVAEHCHLGVIVWSPEFRVVDWNPSAARIFGYSPEEARGMHGSQLVSESARAALNNVWYQALANPGGFRTTTENLTKSGRRISVDWHLTAASDGDNKVSYVVSICEDVSPKVEARRELEEKEQLLETILAATPVSIWVVGRRSERLFTLGDPLSKHNFPSYDEVASYDSFARALKHALHGVQSLVEIEREGCWFDAYIEPLRDPEGAVTGAIVVMTDVTARRKAEREAEVREETYRALTEALPVMVWRRDIKERETIINSTFTTFTGLSVEQFNKGGYRRLLYTEDLRTIATARAQARRQGGPAFWEHRFRRHDGEYRWCYAAITPVKDSEGQIVSWVGTAVDIHDLRSAHEEIRLANQELEQRVEARTRDLAATAEQLQQFAYSVSHDLRGPLRSINGFSKALEEDYGGQLGPEGSDYIRRIRSATMRLADLIDSLLLLSRVTRAQIRRRPVDLSAIANAIIEELQRQPSEFSRIEPEFIVESGLIAEGDEVLLRAVLTNLLDNARKFSGRRDRPKIEIGREDGAFFVRDNGAGFDMAYSDKLFTPFQRLHSESEFPGHGIGLAVVRRIVARHGGEIWARSVEGQGATLYFTLPETVG